MTKEEAREKALEAALRLPGSPESAAAILVNRARVIETYLLSGEVPDLSAEK